MEVVGRDETELGGALYKCRGKAWRLKGWVLHSGAHLLGEVHHASVRDAAA